MTPDGREFNLKICGPDQLVGERGIYSQASKHMMDACVVEDMIFFRISISDLEESADGEWAVLNRTL